MIIVVVGIDAFSTAANKVCGAFTAFFYTGVPRLFVLRFFVFYVLTTAVSDTVAFISLGAFAAIAAFVTIEVDTGVGRIVAIIAVLFAFIDVLTLRVVV